ncbi:MAG TPA: hypothetical protein VGE01_06860, partial [Fimbriimonas sp.]
MTGSGSVVTGVAGASFSEVRVKLPDATQANQDEVKAQTQIAFSYQMRAHTYEVATGKIVDVSGVLGIFRNGSEPSISGLGNKIVSAEWDTGTGRTQLFVSNIDGRDRKRLTASNTYSAYEPSFSPDGTRVVYTRFLYGQNKRLFIVPAAGGTPTALTDGTNSDALAEWSNDGSKILFIRTDGSGGTSVCQINPDQTGFKTI